jgi:ribosomal protein S6
MAELDRALRLADEVIRHKVIRLPDAVANRSAGGPADGDGAHAAAQNRNGAAER